MRFPTVNAELLDQHGQFSAFAWPGGYTILYVDAHGNTLCAACATRRYQEEDASAIYYSTYDEGPMLYCDECNADIESSYGDPDEDETSQEG